MTADADCPLASLIIDRLVDDRGGDDQGTRYRASGFLPARNRNSALLPDKAVPMLGGPSIIQWFYRPETRVFFKFRILRAAPAVVSLLSSGRVFFLDVSGGRAALGCGR